MTTEKMIPLSVIDARIKELEERMNDIAKKERNLVLTDYYDLENRIDELRKLLS